MENNSAFQAEWRFLQFFYDPISYDTVSVYVVGMFLNTPKQHSAKQLILCGEENRVDEW